MILSRWAMEDSESYEEDDGECGLIMIGLALLLLLLVLVGAGWALQ